MTDLIATTAANADPLAGVYDKQGLAYAERVPKNCPVLSCGSKDLSVAPLIEFLNKELGTQLPVGPIVTPDVLAAVRQLRAQRNIPIEQGVYPPDNFVGPNLWAAVKALAKASK